MTTTSLTFATRPTSRLLALGAVSALVVLMAGCGSGDDASGGVASKVASGDAPGVDSAGGANGEESAAGDQDLQGTDSPDGTTARTAETTNARVLPLGRDIVYRGQITVRVRNVARAAARAEALTLEVDGVVFSEQTSVDPRRASMGEATLSLRVPPTQFTSTLDSLGDLGKELSRNRSAQDVTTELADTGSRVRSQERSVERVRALLDEADTIGEVVQVEAELSRREADLESLQAQLARLKDVTDLATVDVTLVARGTPTPAEHDEDELGFGSGLRGGWDAFVEIVLVALTVLGALLPFAVAAAIVGFPAYLLLRSRRQPTATPPTAEA